MSRCHRKDRQALYGSAALFAAVALCSTISAQGLLGPRVSSVHLNPAGELEVIAEVPPGYRHAVLEVIPEDGTPGIWQPMVSGPMTGATGSLRFIIPNQGSRAIARVRVGAETSVPAAALAGLDFMSPSYSDGGFLMAEKAKAVHVLNRIAYGPNPSDFVEVMNEGTGAYIERQLAPESIDESGNAALNDRVDTLFHDFLPYSGRTPILAPGAGCRFFRGSSEPPSNWADPRFNDANWEAGLTGLGYGDEDDATVLDDMRAISGVQAGYLSVYLRINFEVADPTAIENLILRMRYDDGFVAYLNGVEVARENVAGNPPLFDTPAAGGGGNVDNAGAQADWNLNAHRALLQIGSNTLAVQLHNQNLTSSDASVIPALLDYTSAPYPAIKGVTELKQLVHLRGIYSKRQLQAVMAEFWENHFTTDYDKVLDHLEDLDSFQVLETTDEATFDAQTRTEAASLEYAEYQFFHDHALGNFGDLLLYSAASPTMLIYLDSVLNRKNAPNENYAREILELHTHGVNNDYTQFDIEELARCFTGWTIRKMRPEFMAPFPQSVRNPPVTPSLAVDTEIPVIDAGAVWSFFRGTAEPSPAPGGEATADWTLPNFVYAWESGPSGFGFGDDDDTTVLDDMEDSYLSLYARTEFTVEPGTYDSLVLEVDYDDGYVAYLNGVEISRSPSMRDAGSPPAFDAPSNGHEAGIPAIIDLTPFASLLKPAPATNTIAIQGHNTSLSSSDFSLIPRILKRSYTADSIGETDPGGVWAFRFNPDQHDIGSKVIFDGAPHQINIPAGRLGAEGVNDAIDVIDALVSNHATAEFICLKLVNRFVSDEISLDTYEDRSAPQWLLTMMDDAIGAWFSTSPNGNIATVMRSILDPVGQSGGFWLEGAGFSKIKTPVEFINSGFRALEADVTSGNLPDRTLDMGMDLFRRDDPDGYSESGVKWVETLGLLERMKFGQALGSDLAFSRSQWDIDGTLAANGITTPEELIAHFNTLLFSGKLDARRQQVFLDFANTNDAGEPSLFGSLSPTQKTTRLRDLTGLILASPEFQFQ